MQWRILCNSFSCTVYVLDVCHLNVQGIKDCVTSEGRDYICHNAPVEFLETLQQPLSMREKPAEERVERV